MWVKKKKVLYFHINIRTPGLSSYTGFFLEDYLEILIMCVIDLQEGVFYDPSELGIALLAGSGPPLISFLLQ